MDTIELIAGLITLGIPILSFYFGGRYEQAKLLAKMSIEALEDNQITPEEAAKIAALVKKILKG